MRVVVMIIAIVRVVDTTTEHLTALHADCFPCLISFHS